MRVALELAKRGQGRTSPNPAVGAVLVRDGAIVAGGFHAYAGADHAEVDALRKLSFDARGCELYTTLEPCDHQGRTGPCSKAILRSGVRRVVIGALDPNPIVSGRGVKRLVAAGVEVKQGVLETECKVLNEAFNFAIVHGRSFVVLKAAMSLDGRIATATGESRFITSEQARREGHVLRDQLDAILVGVGTVLADDPSLTARIPGGRDPARVIVDSTLRTPPAAKLVETAQKTRTIIATTEKAPANKRKALERRGVTIVAVAEDRAGRVDLTALFERLYALELNSVLVEGGSTVHGAVIDARLANKLLFFVAPLVIGGEGAPGAVGGKGAERLKDALSLDLVSVRPIGPDVLFTCYPRA